MKKYNNRAGKNFPARSSHMNILYGRTTDPARVIFSAISYMFETFPTANFSDSP